MRWFRNSQTWPRHIYTSRLFSTWCWCMGLHGNHIGSSLTHWPLRNNNAIITSKRRCGKDAYSENSGSYRNNHWIKFIEIDFHKALIKLGLWWKLTEKHLILKENIKFFIYAHKGRTAPPQKITLLGTTPALGYLFSLSNLCWNIIDDNSNSVQTKTWHMLDDTVAYVERPKNPKVVCVICITSNL